jgi:tripartite ATP-independent transporter DctM subunit
VARYLRRLAGWLEVYSDAAARTARTLVIAGVVLCGGIVIVNVFTRYVLGFGVTGYDEVASYSFMWIVWMGVSVAVKHGDVTVITFFSQRGPLWWRRSVATFSGLSLAVLFAYCLVRSTQYALSRESLHTSALLGIPSFYGIASMTVGYYFISLHYLWRLVSAAATAAERGGAGMRTAAAGLAGGLAVSAAVWGICAGMLAAGLSPLLALGVIFVALTLAGNPIIFMLSIVGIVSVTGFLGLSFYQPAGSLFPFRTTQNVLGLQGFTELVVILMFLIVAEVMNASGMSDRLIAFAASLVGHFRGGMAYVCQVTSALASGISGSAQADAAIMTPLLVPAMQKEGYPKDVAAAVVAGASIKGPIGPISIVFIVYGVIVTEGGSTIKKLLLSGILAEVLLLLFQGATVYIVVRRLGFFKKRSFVGVRAVGRAGLVALPVLAIPVIIFGGYIRGVFTLIESGAAAAGVAIFLALFWYATLAPRDLPRVLTLAGIETGIVLLLVGDSAILGKVLQINGFDQDVKEFLTGITDNKYAFLLIVNILLLAIGIFVEPLPALYIFAPILAPIAVNSFHIDPTHFGLIVVFNLVLALIHPPLGLVLFLVSGLTKVSVERLSITIIPWLLVSLFVLFLVTYLPSEIVLVIANLLA